MTDFSFGNTALCSIAFFLLYHIFYFFASTNFEKIIGDNMVVLDYHLIFSRAPSRKEMLLE